MAKSNASRPDLSPRDIQKIPNIDYKETYSPLASMNTVRMFLAIANQNNMRIMQFDIKNFPLSYLDEQLYMEQPEGFNRGDGKVNLSNPSTASNRPHAIGKFDQMLKLFNLQQASVDRCLYFNKDRTLLLATYVDDGLAAGSNDTELEQLIDHLKGNFEQKVMACESYLGSFKIIRPRNSASSKTIMWTRCSRSSA